jgi:hypothetical protein
VINREVDWQLDALTCLLCNINGAVLRRDFRSVPANLSDYSFPSASQDLMAAELERLAGRKDRNLTLWLVKPIGRGDYLGLAELREVDWQKSP